MTHPACRCGHPWDIHQHHRGGTDCSPCEGACLAYRRPLPPWAVRALTELVSFRVIGFRQYLRLVGPRRKPRRSWVDVALALIVSERLLTAAFDSINRYGYAHPRHPWLIVLRAVIALGAASALISWLWHLVRTKETP